MFENIKGQDEAIKSIKSVLVNPVNTYVFYGPRGTYVEEAARLFASRLLSEDGSEDQRVISRIHPDVIEYEPAGVTYKIKEDVRESMLDELRKSPIEGKRKVLIVHDADALRDDSANAMLKSLEEPPQNLFWILIAPSPDSLISTIKSRSFAIHFSLLENKLIESILISEGINADKAQEASIVSGGRVDRARKIANEYWPLRQLSKDIAHDDLSIASRVANNSNRVTESFNEIVSDVIAANKSKLEELKSSLKDSGYADKISQSIMASHKKNIEASEKKLKTELMVEFLDSLECEYKRAAKDANENTRANSIHACEIIEASKKRLTFNPSDALFVDSLLSSIGLKQAVNS